jgi:hypothetical protein
MKTHKISSSARDNRLARGGKRQEPSRQPDKVSAAILPDTSRPLFWVVGAAIGLATLAIYSQTSSSLCLKQKVYIIQPATY